MASIYQVLNSLGYTHPVHPTMVYLPIGCIMAAFIFGAVAALCNRPGLLTSARHCVTLALIAVIPTVIFGYVDWQHFLGGAWIFPIRMKMILAGIFLVLLSFTVGFCWKFSANRKTILVFIALCFLNVVAISYYGGEIVFAGFGKKYRNFETTINGKNTQPTATITYADVVDIFQQICIRCHKGFGAPDGLQLDSYEHAMKGGIDGKVIVPGKPDKSELILRIKGLSKPAMPYGMEPLPEKKIETFVRWVEQGAKKF